MVISGDWVGDVLKFWFEETRPEQWFKKDDDFDTSVRRRFLALHEVLAASTTEALFADARTALAAVIVFDQMPRNMFRNHARAFSTDHQAFWIAQAAVAKGLDAGLTKDQRMFLYLPFEHAEDRKAQEQCVALMGTLGDADLTKWAQAHKAIIDRFGRFPHRNDVLGRPSTPEEIEFLRQPGSSF
jgi:uncharacterized protein (DUF924 family)